MPDEAMAEVMKQHLKGALPDDIWKEVVQGFCKTKVPAQTRSCLNPRGLRVGPGWILEGGGAGNQDRSPAHSKKKVL